MAMWAMVRRVVLLLAAFFPPSMAATTDSTSDWPIMFMEQKGNSSFECTISGPCVPCSYSEKENEDIYHCSLTGYYQPYKCLEMKPLTGKGNDEIHTNSNGKHLLHGRKVKDKDSVKVKEKNTTEDKVKETYRREKLMEAEVVIKDGQRVYHTHKSCMPLQVEDRLGVLGFEGIMMLLLFISAPVIYYRKKNNFSLAGMTRIPTTIRF